jgi:AraC-like DNA-binding protein
VATVVAAWTRVIVDYAKRRGLDVTGLLARHGLTEAVLARPEARVAAQVDDELWTAIDRELGDPDLGVHVAESVVSAESFGVVGFLARASGTVAGAVAMTQRYHRLIKDDNRVAVRGDARTLTIVESPGERGVWSRAIAEAVIANYVAMGTAWSGRRVVPLEVRFQHARPADTRELERFFGVAPKFDQPDNAIVLPGHVLTTPLATAETGLLSLLEIVAAAQLQTLGDRAFVDEVRCAVEALLPDEPSIDRVARQLAVSSRSLQRRLAENCSTFRTVVDQARLARAVALVRRGLPVAEVAERVGFSDARAFRRAYLRWTGHTPARHLR